MWDMSGPFVARVCAADRARPPGGLLPARRLPGRLVASATVLALAVPVVAGCAQVRDQADERRVDSGTQVVLPVLDTIDVGLLDGMVSILVRNPTDRLLRSADAVIDVVGPDGRILAGNSIQGTTDYCCTAVNLPPEGTFGFWVQMQPADPADPAGELTLDDLDVRIDYESVVWAAGSAESGAVATAGPDPSLPIAPIDPADPALGVDVTFLVDTTGGILDRAMAQAVLTTVDGRLSAVVTGTLPCLDPADNPSAQRLQLFHEPEPGTTVSSVSVFSLDGHPDPGAASPTPSPGAAACPTT